MTPTIGKSRFGRLCAIAFVLAVVTTATVAAQQPEPAKPTPSTTQDAGAEKPSPPSPRDIVFDMGQIVVVGTPRDSPASAARC